MHAGVETPSGTGTFAALWAYNGSWKITATGGAKPDELINQCVEMGQYFSCQQKVNGAVSQLLVFTPTSTPGAFTTHSILSNGGANSRGSLVVEGNKWFFLTRWNQGGKTTYYRTVNTFAGKTKMHFEQQESSDNKDWKTTKSGDELRTAPGRQTVIR